MDSEERREMHSKLVQRWPSIRRWGKRLHRLSLWPHLLVLSFKRWIYGIEAVNEQLVRSTIGVGEVLAHFGASIGQECVIHGPLILHNTARDYSNLVIGNNVHVGRGVLLDLADEIILEDDAVISMNCTLLTHQNVGERALKGRHRRQIQALRIGAGAYLGASVTVLAGCHVGARTTVGAGAVLTQPLPEDVTAVGVPARIIRHHTPKLKEGGR
jgi:acetyltransferase-like isoleucine patch superfamily enzyme